MITRTEEQQQAMMWRAAEWQRTTLAPVAAAVQAYGLATGRGQPPAARVWLRNIVRNDDAARDVALATLDKMILGLLQGDGLTAIACAAARAAAKATGCKLESDAHAASVGYVLVGIVCDVTGAAAIVNKYGDAPKKVAGGVMLQAAYELRTTKGSFLTDCVTFGKVGMPSYSLTAPAPWTGQNAGGVEGQADGMGLVHAADKAMVGIGPAEAPGMYAAVNGAQAARFRVNPATAAVFLAYDAGAAYDWLLARFLAEGLDEKSAKAKASDLARL